MPDSLDCSSAATPLSSLCSSARRRASPSNSSRYSRVSLSNSVRAANSRSRAWTSLSFSFRRASASARASIRCASSSALVSMDCAAERLRLHRDHTTRFPRRNATPRTPATTIVTTPIQMVIARCTPLSKSDQVTGGSEAFCSAKKDKRRPPLRPCGQAYLNLRNHRWVPIRHPSPALRAGIGTKEPGNPSNRCWFNDSFTHHQPRRDLQIRHYSGRTRCP